MLKTQHEFSSVIAPHMASEETLTAHSKYKGATEPRSQLWWFEHCRLFIINGTQHQKVVDDLPPALITIAVSSRAFLFRLKLKSWFFLTALFTIQRNFRNKIDLELGYPLQNEQGAIILELEMAWPFVKKGVLIDEQHLSVEGWDLKTVEQVLDDLTWLPL